MDATEAAWIPLLDRARELGPDPELRHLDDDQVEHEVRDGAARIAALTCRWLLHVAELVVRGGWAEAGVRTPGAWLSWRCGVAQPTAREYVRVALALRNAPKIRARFLAGTISYSKVRAITRVVAPQTEDTLLELADKAPASQLERIVAGCRHALSEQERWAEGPPPPDEIEAWDFTRRQVTPDVVEYRVRMPSEAALAFDTRVERLVDLADRDQSGEVLGAPTDEDPTDEDTPTNDDAPRIARVPITVRRSLAVSDALAVAVADGAPDRSGADDHLVVLHVDVDDLVAAAGDAPTAEAQDDRAPAAVDGATVSAETVVRNVSAETSGPRGAPPPRQRVVTGRGRATTLRRSVLAALACDADLRVAGICRDEGDDGQGHRHPADIGRRSRKVPPDLRRAVLLRDTHCRFPGCHRTFRLHAHHVVHWARGGPTDLANLVALCAFHHRFVHRAKWELRPVDAMAGRWTFHRPGQDVPHPAAPPLGGASAETAAAQALDADPPPDALEPDWWDGQYDLSMTISVFTRELRELDPALPDLARAA